MKLNSVKYVFGVKSRKFLMYMVNQQGIEANLNEISFIKKRSLAKPKEVQSLRGKVSALIRFISWEIMRTSIPRSERVPRKSATIN